MCQKYTVTDVLCFNIKKKQTTIEMNTSDNKEYSKGEKNILTANLSGNNVGFNVAFVQNFTSKDLNWWKSLRHSTG